MLDISVIPVYVIGTLWLQNLFCDQPKRLNGVLNYFGLGLRKDTSNGNHNNQVWSYSVLNNHHCKLC